MGSTTLLLGAAGIKSFDVWVRLCGQLYLEFWALSQRTHAADKRKHLSSASDEKWKQTHLGLTRGWRIVWHIWQRCSKLDRTVFVGVSEWRFHFPLRSNDHLAATKWNNNLVFPLGWMNNIITNHPWYLSLQVALTKTNILIKLSAIHHTCCDFLK